LTSPTTVISWAFAVWTLHSLVDCRPVHKDYLTIFHILSSTRVHSKSDRPLLPSRLSIMFSKLTFVATAALLLISPVIAADSNCTRTYTIAAGDICDGISRAQNVSTYQLAAVNSATVDATCSNLQIGEVLCLGTPGEDCTDIHFVADADSCSTIQTTYGLNSTILLQNNPNVDEACDNLYTGLALCVATTVMAPPIPAGFFNNNTTGSVDWVPVSPDDVGDDEDLPYCDEVDDDSN